jgi:hypothetical protein
VCLPGREVEEKDSSSETKRLKSSNMGINPGASSITVAGKTYPQLLLSNAVFYCTDHPLLQSESDLLLYEKQHNCKKSSGPSFSFSFVVKKRSPTDCVGFFRVKTDDSTLFLGDGSLAAVPTPKLNTRGIRSVIKVVDERCL